VDAQAKADIGIDILDGIADAWAEDINLHSMIKNVTSPMGLNRTVPDAVRDKFRNRMEAQIDAIVRQAFLEGALRGVDLVNDDLRSLGVIIPAAAANE
jgi:hypothetical protein